MDHLTIEENNVVERYLLKQLAAGEAGRFEEHYLDCPECLEKLELSKRLYQGLQGIATESAAKTLTQTAFLAWILRRSRGLQAGLVIAFLAVAALPWALLAPEVSRMRTELDQALTPRTGSVSVVLSPERSAPGDEPSVQLSLTPAPEWLGIVLQLPPYQTSTTYRVRLARARGKTLWQSEPIEPDASGQVSLSVHSTWLEAADYTLELEGSSAGGESQPVTRFPFRVRRGE